MPSRVSLRIRSKNGREVDSMAVTTKSLLFRSKLGERSIVLAASIIVDCFQALQECGFFHQPENHRARRRYISRLRTRLRWDRFHRMGPGDR